MYATISQAPRRGRRNSCCNATLGAHKMARGGDVNVGFSTMDFGDGKWSVRKKRFLKTVCLEETIFFHSEGLLSRQFIFQSLTESHKVPLLGANTEHGACIDTYYGREYLLTSSLCNE